MARFEQEARSAAALNHPGIVSIFDADVHEGTSYFVTELVDGRTLRTLLAEGPVPLRKTLDIGSQVADALAAAHGAGIIHRDLKPENIMVTRGGQVKILDFGIAKLATSKDRDQDAHSTTTLVLTPVDGVIGTPGYMSPEQVRNTIVDHRSDIFSLGVVLYEMLAGKRAFHSDTSAECLTAILRTDPAELPEAVPASIRSIVWRCIDKDPANRFQSAQDLAFSLRNTGSATSVGQPAVPPAATTARWILPLILGALLIVASLISLLVIRSTSGGVEQFDFIPVALGPGMDAFPNFSPDGKSVAYLNDWKLFVRSIDAALPTQLTSTEVQSRVLTWHPTGSHLYFTDHDGPVRSIFRISVTGGTPVKFLANCSGGVLTPDGKAMLCWRKDADGKSRLYVSSPPGADPTVLANAINLVDGANPRFAADGTKFLVQVGRQLWIVPFPSGTPQAPRELADTGMAYAWLPDSRHIVVQIGGAVESQTIIADTLGDERRALLRGPDAVISLDVSRDGKRVAYSSGFPTWHIGEFGSDGRRLGTFVGSHIVNLDARWSRSGDAVVYFTGGPGPLELWMRVMGQNATVIARVPSPGNWGTLASISPDGRRVAYSNGKEVWVVPAGGGQSVSVFTSDTTVSGLTWSPGGESLLLSDNSRLLKMPADGGQLAVLKSGDFWSSMWSPDGRWIWYDNATGCYLLSTETSSQRHISNSSHDCDFAADSKHILCLESNGKSTYELVTREVDSGREIKRVTVALDRPLTMYRLSLHPDGTRFLTNVGQMPYDIWIAEGFAQPTTGWTRWLRHWKLPTLSDAHVK
jgi:serine/threonine protein kinase